MRVARKELVRRVPPSVRAIVDRIVAAGGGAWLVGGTVRDLLLDVEPRDYDIATDRRPEQLAAMFDAADILDARFGAVRLPTEVGKVGLTTLRSEAGYEDHRHPDHVEFVTDLGVDAARRDFTVNALYYDCAAGEVIDPIGDPGDPGGPGGLG